MHLRDLSWLPQQIIEKYAELGYDELLPIQEDAIKKGFDNNLLIFGPSGSGKTLIGELAALWNLLKKNKRTFYLVSLKALAEEKFIDFTQKFYNTLGINVAITTSEKTEYDDRLLSYDLIIATYEKLDSLLRNSPQISKEIGLVVIDEIQNISSEQRGTALEMLIVKLQKAESAPTLIALSASIGNPEDVRKWLKSELVQRNQRPIELKEGVWRNNLYKYIEFNTGQAGEEEIGIDSKTDVSREAVLNLAKTLIEREEQVIVFTDTKSNAEGIAERLAQMVSLPKTAVYEVLDFCNHVGSMFETTENITLELNCTKNGVCFHHADLLPEIKLELVKLFAKGYIRCIVATTSLAEGINAPAKTALFETTSWRFLRQDFPVNLYKNMAGRAGRKRFHDDFGRSIIVATNRKEEENAWNNFINRKYEPVISQIPTTEIDAHILGLIAAFADTEETLLSFLVETYYSFLLLKRTSKSVVTSTLREVVQRNIKSLIDSKMVAERHRKLKLTEYGEIVSKNYLQPKTADTIKRSLVRLKKRNLDEEGKKFAILHALCCTSTMLEGGMVYATRWEQRELLQFFFKNSDRILVNFDELPRREDLYNTLKTALVLDLWINGKSSQEIWEKYKISEGHIKRISEKIAWLLDATTQLSDLPEINVDKSTKELISTLVKQTNFGLPPEHLKFTNLDLPGKPRKVYQTLAEKISSIDELVETPIDKLPLTRTHKILVKNSVLRIVRSNNYLTNRESILLEAYLNAKDYQELKTLFLTSGTSFERVVFPILRKLGFEVSNTTVEHHGPDYIIRADPDIIAIECKGKENHNLVSAVEAEEILGKGKKYSATCFVTIGKPDFSDEAIKNCQKSKVTLLPAATLGKALLLKYKEPHITEKLLYLFKTHKRIDPNDLL